ncbi:hypothetical protein DL96DRAFT_255634 [Flagelloscypha sp. PMI_526]|nr:hypothetical protein DL96DRAFT_255634 [Flagelloscypha sp. PMI_526]
MEHGHGKRREMELTTPNVHLAFFFPSLPLLFAWDTSFISSPISLHSLYLCLEQILAMHFDYGFIISSWLFITLPHSSFIYPPICTFLWTFFWSIEEGIG